MNETFPMLSGEGRGKELSDLLREELGIPKGVQSFEVRFARGEPVTVTCQYLPDDPTHIATVRFPEVRHEG